MKTNTNNAIILLTRFFLSSADCGVTMRQGLFHSPIMAKNTGLPCHAAASTRNGRFDPGHTPVHAARVSDAPSAVHSGAAGCSLEASMSAAENRALQSGGLVAALSFAPAGALSFCGGIAC